MRFSITLTLTLLNCFGMNFLGVKKFQNELQGRKGNFRSLLPGCKGSVWDDTYTLEITPPPLQKHYRHCLLVVLISSG